MKKMLSILLVAMMVTGVFVKSVFATGVAIHISVDHDTGYVTISGTIPSGADKAVTLLVLNPSMQTDLVDQQSCDTDGRYSFSYKPSTAGTYTVKISSLVPGGSGETIFHYDNGTTPTPTPTGDSVISPNVVKVDLQAQLDKASGAAKAAVDWATLNAALAMAKENADGIKFVVLHVFKVEGATQYDVKMPATALSAGSGSQKFVIETALGTVVAPDNMFSNSGLQANKELVISIGEADRTKLGKDVLAQIAARPVIELNISVDGKKVDFNNPDAPIRVEIPYKATAKELQRPEHIVIWYINEIGKAVPVSNGKYDSDTGTVVFTTTHFSRYAVAYVVKSFRDLTDFAWAKDQIEVLASKGIINGTSETTFKPAAKITRADFTLLLMKTLELINKADTNFEDIVTSDYYYDAVGTAKKLGIVNGQGANRFNPSEELSRQDMMVMAARALRIADMLQASSGTDLTGFKDKVLVADYAAADISALVSEGLIEGMNGTLNPLGHVRRAEAAVLLYRIYNK